MRIFKQITANDILLKEIPFKMELSMEAYLAENEQILSLDETDFADAEFLDHQLTLSNAGKEDGKGRLDIVVRYSDTYIGVAELKKGEVSYETLDQLERYINQKDEIISQLKARHEKLDFENKKWVGILIGDSIDSKLGDELNQGKKINGEIPIAALVLRRYQSDHDKSIFVVSDTYFNYNYSKKDYSKFRFQGEDYNKGKLVNAVIKFWIRSNPEITFIELKKCFPDEIQKHHGVFTTAIEARELFNRTGHKRYYVDQTRTVFLKEGIEIATCNQWNPFNLKAFIEQSRFLGIIIEEL